MINIAICDDDEKQRGEVKKLCEKYENKYNMSFSYIEFSSGIKVIEYEKHIDILFLDIEMPEMNGLEVMEKINYNENVDIIIFVSGYDMYDFDIFSSKTRGYIKKPIIYEKFERNIDKAIEELKRKKIIKLVASEKIVYIRTDDLIYAKTMGNYMKVYCKDNVEYIVYGSMKHWSESLAEYGIIRVSSSYMVNLKYVNGWWKTIKIGKENKEIHVGRSFYEKGKEEYVEYVKKQFL